MKKSGLLLIALFFIASLFNENSAINTKSERLVSISGVLNFFVTDAYAGPAKTLPKQLKKSRRGRRPSPACMKMSPDMGRCIKTIAAPAAAAPSCPTGDLDAATCVPRQCCALSAINTATGCCIGTQACNNYCDPADYTQNPYPDCSCVAIPPPPPSCSAGCAAPSSQYAYPDCSCYCTGCPYDQYTYSQGPPTACACTQTGCNPSWCSWGQYGDCSCMPPPTASPSPSPTPTGTGTATPTPTPTGTGTGTPTPTPTATPTPPAGCTETCPIDQFMYTQMGPPDCDCVIAACNLSWCSDGETQQGDCTCLADPTVAPTETPTPAPTACIYPCGNGALPDNPPACDACPTCPVNDGCSVPGLPAHIGLTNADCSCRDVGCPNSCWDSSAPTDDYCSNCPRQPNCAGGGGMSGMPCNYCYMIPMNSDELYDCLGCCM